MSILVKSVGRGCCWPAIRHVAGVVSSVTVSHLRVGFRVWDRTRRRAAPLSERGQVRPGGSEGRSRTAPDPLEVPCRGFPAHMLIQPGVVRGALRATGVAVHRDRHPCDDPALLRRHGQTPHCGSASTTVELAKTNRSCSSGIPGIRTPAATGRSDEKPTSSPTRLVSDRQASRELTREAGPGGWQQAVLRGH